MGVILIGYFNINFVWLGKGEFLINDDIKYNPGVDLAFSGWLNGASYIKVYTPNKE